MSLCTRTNTNAQFFSFYWFLGWFCSQKISSIRPLFHLNDFHPLCLVQEEREAEIKNLRQSLNFKAMPMPGFYRGLKASKSPLDKVCTVPAYEVEITWDGKQFETLYTTLRYMARSCLWLSLFNPCLYAGRFSMLENIYIYFLPLFQCSVEIKICISIVSYHCCRTTDKLTKPLNQSLRKLGFYYEFVKT